MVGLTNAQVLDLLRRHDLHYSRWTLRRVPYRDLPYGTTPGGHRRYAEHAVAGFIAGQVSSRVKRAVST